MKVYIVRVTTEHSTERAASFGASANAEQIYVVHAGEIRSTSTCLVCVCVQCGCALKQFVVPQ